MSGCIESYASVEMLGISNSEGEGETAEQDMFYETQGEEHRMFEPRRPATFGQVEPKIRKTTNATEINFAKSLARVKRWSKSMNDETRDGIQKMSSGETRLFSRI